MVPAVMTGIYQGAPDHVTIVFAMAFHQLVFQILVTVYLLYNGPRFLQSEQLWYKTVLYIIFFKLSHIISGSPVLFSQLIIITGWSTYARELIENLRSKNT